MTSVVVRGTQGYYTLDDFTYEAVAVPEPASLGLILVGLATCGGS